MDKSTVQGLIFYFENSAELDPGIQEKTLDVLGEYLEVIEQAEAAAKKKRQSPNKSGIYQINDKGEVICMYKTQNDALVALGKENKSGISDAVRGRVKTHKAYGYTWRFVDEYQAEHPGFKYTGPIYGEE
jgi:hypothetical protein